MTFDPNQIVGLTPFQRKVYECAMRLVARCGAAPRYGDVRRALMDAQTEHIRYAIRRLLKRKYLKEQPDGGLLALNPPHVKALQDICHRYRITLDDLRGPEKTLRMQRIRREFASKMRRECSYSFRAIAVLLNRARATVEVFCKPEERRRRSDKRIARYRAAAAERRAQAHQGAAA